MSIRLLRPFQPAARTVLRATSPRHRRWHDLLTSCTLTPDAVTAAHSPGPRDVVICGCPRSGPALAPAAHQQPPTMATREGPWAGLRRAPDALFAPIRRDLATGTQRRGRLRLDLLEAEGDVAWQRDGERSFPVRLAPDGLVGVKWPSYWQLIGRLPRTRFVVCVRHPDDVVRSMAATGGRIGEGLDYDTAFTADLNHRLLRTAPTAPERRLAMYDEVYRHVLDHADEPNVFLLHYERWADDSQAVLEELSGFLDVREGEARAQVVQDRVAGLLGEDRGNHDVEVSSLSLIHI